MILLSRVLTYSFFFLLISGCQSRNVEVPFDICDQILIPCLKEKAFVEIKTNKGSFIIALNGKLAPLTSGNFLDLVNKGAYNGTFFNVVVNSPKPFILRGGNSSPSIKRKLIGLLSR